MRFLIVKTSAFGDVVQAFCVLNYLKAIRPGCTIDWVVEKKIAPIVRAHPLVDRVIEIDAKRWKKRIWDYRSWTGLFSFLGDLRKESYDAVFDLQGNLKSGLIDFFTRTHTRVGFGWKTAPERINCTFTSHRSNPPRGQNIRRDYLFVVQNYFKDFFQTPYEVIDFSLTEKEQATVSSIEQHLGPCAWMICPGSAWKNKILPEEKLQQFLLSSQEAFCPKFIFIWGTPQEKEAAERLAKAVPGSIVSPALTLPELQQLMKKVELIVSMDSFPLHLAGTTNTATFSFFGPTVSYKYRPIGENHFSFQGSCPYGFTFDKRCRLLRSCAKAPCLTSQESAHLFQPFQDWWTQKKSALAHRN